MIYTFSRKISTLSLLLWLCACSVVAQIQQPVKFEVSSQRLDGDMLEIVFKGKVDAGWHVYGTDFADGGPTIATLTLEQQDGVKPVGKLEMRGSVHRAMDEMFGMDVTYMEGTATFAQRFKFTAETYSLKGYLTYGACNDENCMPPTDVDFSFTGEGCAAAPQAAAKVVPAESVEPVETVDAVPEDSTAESTSKQPTSPTLGEESSWWSPVIDELRAYETLAANNDTALWKVFLMGLIGGLLALLTPCVWPIIPMTVSFFLKRSKDKAKGVRDALTYGASIVVIYLALGLFVTMLFGANALNALSTNAGFNIFFFLMLLLFGASFLGGFELTLPSSWTNAVDRKSESTTGLLSIFLMAFTLSLVSFSCTGPIIGFLLVEVAQEGSIMAPAVGMFGFALALALPFSLFALFPTWLKSVPRSGGWMNVVKVSLGFLELAFSLKFFSVADLAYGWHLLDREVFLSLWIVLFTLLGAYLLGWIRLPHDEDEYDGEGNVVTRPRIGVTRLFAAAASWAFALYMVPGLWGAPCKAVSAFAPPASTQDFNLYDGEVHARFTDYDEGMRYAQQQHLPVMLDFTGYGCVNCRKMEAAVWTDPTVAELMNERYVLITLFVDDRTPLPQVMEIEEQGETHRLRTVGDKWSYLQRSKFGANAQPFYVLVNNEGRPLTGSYSYREDVQAFRSFLLEGLKKYGK